MAMTSYLILIPLESRNWSALCAPAPYAERKNEIRRILRTIDLLLNLRVSSDQSSSIALLPISGSPFQPPGFRNGHIARNSIDLKVGLVPPDESHFVSNRYCNPSSSSGHLEAPVRSSGENQNAIYESRLRRGVIRALLSCIDKLASRIYVEAGSCNRSCHPVAFGFQFDCEKSLPLEFCLPLPGKVLELFLSVGGGHS